MVAGFTCGPTCNNGFVEKRRIRFSSSGLIESSTAEEIDGIHDEVYEQDEVVKVEAGETVIPGLLELHTNGLVGIHFTTLTKANHEDLLSKVAHEMAKNGVTAWYATIPTVHESKWKEVRSLEHPSRYTRH